MGTTLTAWQSGSFAFKYVVAIEGYQYLLTDAAPAAAVTAWTGTDWTQALGGLVVDMQNHGEINPWVPFGGGGTLRLWVQPDATDQFGIDTHRKTAGAETQLAATADHDDTTITVNDTSSFAAGPNFLYIGTECINYSSKPSSTTFAISKRGMFAPFASGGASPVGFSEHHRVGLDTNQVALSPVVTQQPRVWIGKWVGVWVHRISRGTDLDSKANAQLVFAGRIVGISDDPNTGWTVVEVQHVLDYVKDATLGRSLFAGQLADGVYLSAGTLFGLQDVNATGTVKGANALNVVASGASGANQINEGFYSHAQLCSALNNWLASELNAARIYGHYWFASPVKLGDSTWHTTIQYQIPPGTGSATPAFTAIFPPNVCQLLGFSKVTLQFDGTAIIEGPFQIVTDGSSGTFWYTSPSPAQRTDLSWKGTQTNRILVTKPSGTFCDQSATLPIFIRPPNPGTNKYGVFLVDNKLPIRGSYDAATGYITNIMPLLVWFGSLSQGSNTDVFSAFTKSFDDPNEIHIRQVIMAEYPFLGLIARAFYGTGTSAYNSATYDDLGYGLGLGIPGELLGTNFETSISNLPGASNSSVLVLDKTTKLVDVFAGDLVLRRASLIWKQGTLRFTQIVTPTTNVAVATLDETTKALASDSQDQSGQRASTLLTTDWQKSIVKIDYNRSLTDLSGGGGYQSTLTLEDSTSVDDQGGAGDPYTIEARNTYGQFNGTGSGIEQLVPNFLATMPLFSRPVRRQARPIDLRYFEQLAAGDVVLVTDKFARDPATGTRGVTARPGVIVKFDYTLGSIKPGGDPGKPSPIAGSCEVFFLDVNRGAAYCPTAQVDETQNAGGFTAGYDSATLQLRCYAHQHTEASEAADASFFAVGDVVLICEIDPATTGSPVFWVRTVTAVSSNDITINSALSAPAFDTTKKYRITADHYGDVQASQQAKTFNASSTTGSVESTRAPYEYATSITPGVSSFTPWAAGELGEFIPDLASINGQARDTGNDRALVRLINALHDYRTAHCSPILWAQRFPSPAGGATYRAVYYSPIFLGPDLDAPGLAYRYLRVAPFFKSSSGSSISVRVTLMRDPLSSGSLDDVNRGTVYTDATWTTSSTTYAIGTEALLPTAGIKNGDGMAYLLVEGTNGSATYGLAECQETMRQTT